MKSWIVSIVLLVVGFFGGYLTAKRTLRKTTLPTFFSNVGELFLHPVPGDTIKFRDVSGNDLEAEFKYGQNPCTNAMPAAYCIIGPNPGLFFYKCKGCQDPGVGVGSVNTALDMHSRGILPPPYADPSGVQIYCEAGKPKAHPVKAARGESFQLYPVGGVVFTATFAPNTCTTGNVLQNGSTSCTLTATATIPQDFAIHTDKCGDGFGTLSARP